MRCLSCVVVVVLAFGGLLIFAGSVFWAGSAGAAEAQKPDAPPPDLCARLARDNIRFTLLGGRVVATANQGQMESSTTTPLGGSQHETLNLQISENSELSLKYELMSHDQSVDMTVDIGGAVTIHRRMGPADSAADVTFSQPPLASHDPLRLTVSSAGRVKQLHGATVWHLLVADPQMCSAHLAPLLAMLRPDWRLMETAHAIEDQMLSTAKAYDPETTKRWGQWVSQLGSEKFLVRQAAERQLRAAGPVALPYLAALDRRQLDLEQWSRVCGILGSDDATDEDNAANCTNELTIDCDVWLSLMDRQDEGVRSLAARQFAWLVGKPIKFDPAANDATRSQQLEALRTEFARPAMDN